MSDWTFVDPSQDLLVPRDEREDAGAGGLFVYEGSTGVQESEP